MSEDERTQITDKLAAAKEALKGSDVELIKKTTEELLQASHKLAEAAYSQARSANRRVSKDDAVEGEVVEE